MERIDSLNKDQRIGPDPEHLKDININKIHFVVARFNLKTMKCIYLYRITNKA